jgi:S-DNA-T family DNA segregation ATPase FtsK/SpoIIIE
MAATKKNARRTSKKKKEAARKARLQLWSLIGSCGLLLPAFVPLEGESGWRWMHGVLFGLFGWSAYLWGPLFLRLSYLASRDKLGSHPALRLTLNAVMMALLAAAAQIFGAGMPAGISAAEKAVALYDSGLALKGGGVFSSLLGLPLMALGTPGDKIPSVLLIFVLGMFLTGTTLETLFGAVKKPIRTIGDAYQERLEESRTSSAKFDIDVPLDGPAPALPAGPESRLPPDMLPETGLAKERLLTALAADASAPAAEEAHPPEPDIQDLVRKKVSAQRSGALKTAAEAPVYVAADDGSGRNLPGQLTFDPDARAANPMPGGYQIPPITLLRAPERQRGMPRPEEIRENEQRLVNTLKSFGVETRVIATSTGPAVTRYELQPSAGVKISRITGLADDIALNLAASGVRIEAPIPNKAAVGIEVPNRTVCPVTLREAIDSRAFYESKSRLTMALGRDISGHVTVADITRMPHLLIAGATGSGKSVCINAIIMSLLYKSTPEQVRLLMVDPKVWNWALITASPNFWSRYHRSQKSPGLSGPHRNLKRYQLFAQTAQGIASYNNYVRKRQRLPRPPPPPCSHRLPKTPQSRVSVPLYLSYHHRRVSDLMMAAPNGRGLHLPSHPKWRRLSGGHALFFICRAYPGGPSVDVSGRRRGCAWHQGQDIRIARRVPADEGRRYGAGCILRGGFPHHPDMGAQKLLGAGDCCSKGGCPNRCVSRVLCGRRGDRAGDPLYQERGRTPVRPTDYRGHRPARPRRKGSLFRWRRLAG